MGVCKSCHAGREAGRDKKSCQPCINRYQIRKHNRDRGKETNPQQRCSRCRSSGNLDAAASRCRHCQQYDKTHKNNRTSKSPVSLSVDQATIASKPPWDTIIWTTAPAEHAVIENPTVAIEVTDGSLAVLERNPWLAKARDLDVDLGDTIVAKSTESMVLHQGLATVLYAGTLGLDIHVDTWSWLANNLKHRLLPAWLDTTFGPNRSIVIFLHWTSTHEPQDLTFQHTYEAIRNLRIHYSGRIRPYPSQSELWQDRLKVGDIRALDEIASRAPAEFSHRPKTCFGLGECTLKDQPKTVHKRTHSSCGKHV